jgi:hypothetical protein
MNSYHFDFRWEKKSKTEKFIVRKVLRRNEIDSIFQAREFGAIQIISDTFLALLEPPSPPPPPMWHFSLLYSGF